MPIERNAGILLHPTSFPGPFGIGDIGPEAYRWVDFLKLSGTRYWQILPLGPTGYGDSPYQCFSAFAGNPFLVSPEILLDEGLLEQRDLRGKPKFPKGRIDFGPTIIWKNQLLDKAFDHFIDGNSEELNQEFRAFLEAEKSWLVIMPSSWLSKRVKTGHPG